MKFLFKFENKIKYKNKTFFDFFNKDKSPQNIFGAYKNAGWSVGFQLILEVPFDIIGPSFAKTGPQGVLCLHDLIHHVDAALCLNCGVA